MEFFNIFIEADIIQWIILVLFGLLFFAIAPLSKTVDEFFSAKKEDGAEPGMLLLAASLVISWIFAKSITNAANLGMEFGMVGSIAYAVYYLSFLVAGYIIYQLRIQGGFKSIHHFLKSKFGRSAVHLFSILICIRLFNEVWSNTMVIGSYFGEAQSGPYILSIIVVTILTLAYTMKGGMRSSLLTDAIQMFFFGLMLFVILALILPDKEVTIGQMITSGEWKMETGLNLLLAALLQVFSYPFHDPVLTDRGFISSPKITLRSFFIASVVGFACIVLFSFVGIYASAKGLVGQAPVEVAKLMGLTGLLTINLIMITSAASTLDSTFSSFSKLVVIDLGREELRTVSRGRWMMVLIVVLGTIPIFFNPEILSATTVSGTMVMGLAPVFLLWKLKAPALSFQLAVWFGIAVGVLLAADLIPEALVFTSGRYSSLLWANIWGLLVCFGLFLLPVYLKNGKRETV